MTRRLPPPKGKPLDRETTPPKRFPPPSRRLPPTKRSPPTKAPNKLPPQELEDSSESTLGSGCVPKKFDSRIHCIACTGSGISSAKTRCVPCEGTGKKKYGTY